jgi:hypothetical protein
MSQHHYISEYIEDGLDIEVDDFKFKLFVHQKPFTFANPGDTIEETTLTCRDNLLVVPDPSNPVRLPAAEIAIFKCVVKGEDDEAISLREIIGLVQSEAFVESIDFSKDDDELVDQRVVDLYQKIGEMSADALDESFAQNALNFPHVKEAIVLASMGNMAQSGVPPEVLDKLMKGILGGQVGGMVITPFGTIQFGPQPDFMTGDDDEPAEESGDAPPENPDDPQA